MSDKIAIRNAIDSDHEFIFELSPILAEVAKLDWHTDETLQKMQDNYISEMLTNTNTPHITMIAELANIRIGFVHVRAHKDGISGEMCAAVTLLAVSPKSHGSGAGKVLMSAAEQWAKKLGCRLLHLEVFANNTKANRFYEKLGFKPEILHRVKTI
jgi:GNAT superfamily N-acetyltransferase